MLKYLMAAATAVVLMTSLAPQAEARRWVGIGLNIGIPIYPRPYYAPYYYPYYPPYPAYPAYVAPAPVYVQPAPVVVQPSVPPQPVPVVRPFEARGSGYEETVPPPAMQGDANRFLQQLSNQDERARTDAAIDLGRMRAQQAIDPLCTMLVSDRSPAARETAARALGLIGNPRALNALQNAAQADNDRDVRRSAQFSAEVIRANLRKD